MIDHFIKFNKPHDCLQHQYQQQQSGLTGGRVSLIPHQLYIADEVGNRFAPRVLLADEVGLGKNRSGHPVILIIDNTLHK